MLLSPWCFISPSRDDGRILRQLQCQVIREGFLEEMKAKLEPKEVQVG